MPEAISPKTARLLKDVNGETQLDASVRSALEVSSGSKRRSRSWGTTTG
jgi:hypothetical protein